MASTKYTLASRVKVRSMSPTTKQALGRCFNVGPRNNKIHHQLATGQTMPQIQLGLYMMSGREATNSVRWALAAGYRGFDCAQMYHNEREAGRAILDFLDSNSNNVNNEEPLARDDVHYTTKLASCSTNYDAVRRSIKTSVDVSGLGHVDLMLLHSPYGGREARLTSWRALEDAVAAGEVKMAGVSNYGVKHVSGLIYHCKRAARGKQASNFSRLVIRVFVCMRV